MPRNLSEQDIADFQDRLCDIAERQFVHHGAESVTIRHLASALGVSPMTPYRYFKDKDAILAAVRARAFDRHAEALENAYARNAADPGSRARAILDAYIDFAFANPEAYKLMFDIRHPTEADYPELVRAGERSRATMTLQLRDLIEAGRLQGDPDRIGHMYWAAIHGALMLHFSGLLSGDHDVRTLINALVMTLGRAIFGDAAARDTPAIDQGPRQPGGRPV